MTDELKAALLAALAAALSWAGLQTGVYIGVLARAVREMEAAARQFQEQAKAAGDAVDAAEARIKALELAIEDAPHEQGCPYLIGDTPGPCKCFKSRLKERA